MRRRFVPVRMLLLCAMLLSNVLSLTTSNHGVVQAQELPSPAIQEISPTALPHTTTPSTSHTAAPTGRQFTQTFYLSADSFVCASSPDTNYGTASYLRVSRMLSPYDECRILVRFDLTDLPGNADVLAATLELYSDTASSGARAHAALGSWKESQVTWNNKPAASATSVGALSASAGWQQWSVRDFVQDWVDGTLQYNGFMMVQDDTVFGQTDYQSRDGGNPSFPRLVVTYQTEGSPMMLPAEMDTWVNEALPSNNYGAVDYLRTNYDGAGTGTRAYVLLKFDTSDLPSNITVVSATLELYSMINRTQSTASNPLLFGEDIYPDTVRSSWDEMSVTWNSKPVAYGDDPPSPYALGWMEWDVTTAAQGWVSGTLTNYGIQLRVYDPDGGFADFTGRPSEFAPRLTIYYEPLPPVCEPVTAVRINGPTVGNTSTDYTFDAQAGPLDATAPFTYTWTATDQSPITIVTSNTTHSVAFNWATAGTKTVNVTAENCSGTASDTHQVTIATPPPTCPVLLTGLSFVGPTLGQVGDGYSFRVTATPKTATTPVTFTWQADGQSPVAVSGAALQSTQVYTWSTLGPKAITVTAANCGSAFVRYHTIDIVEPWELPDLDVTTAWYEVDNQRIGFLVQNIGGSTALAGHIATLDQGDSVPDEDIAFPYDLQPGAIRETYFDVTRTCTTASEPVQICADTTDRVVEGDETNNCWQLTWPCDMNPPAIISGPTVVTTTETTATIAWQTNEPCSSEVHYDSSSVYYRESKVTGGYTTDHQVTLTGLDAESLYHFYVLVTDMGDTSVNSDEEFFETQSKGSDPPTITYLDTVVYPDAYYDFYVIQTSVDDIAGLDRIEFTCDGVLIKTEYFYPGHGLNAYAIFSPHALGYTRDTFFGTSHTVTVKAVNLNDAQTTQSQLHSPSTPPKHIKAEMLAPSQGETVYVPSDPAPAGSEIDVVVKAAQFEWGCTYSAFSEGLPTGIQPVDCDDVDSVANGIEVRLDGALVATYTPGSGDFEHTFPLDLTGKIAGAHTVEVIAHASDGSTDSVQRTINVTIGTPSLSMERTVTRLDNYFEVVLTLKNHANATWDANIARLFDDMQGFQVIKKSTQPGLLAPTAECQSYTVDPFSHNGSSFTLKVDFNSGIMLTPGESCTVSYSVVPVLREYTMDYNIGSTGTVIHYDTGGETLFAASGNLNSAVSDAFKQSDYLIVTNPGRLVGQYGAGDDVNALLSEMARLAQLKRGALGYLDSYGDKQVLDDLVEPNGYWTTSMYDDFKWVRKGYMLIVGESEIVGAWDYNNLDLDWEDSNVDDAPYSDHAYANTKGDGAPDLIVGRIIGNNPIQLRNAIRTSVNVAVGAWEFDRTNALLVSGTGGSVGDFEDNVNDVRSDLQSDGWDVVKLHWNDDIYRFPISFAQDFEQYDGFAAGDVIAGGKAEMVIAQRTGDHFIIRDIDGNTVGGFDRSFDAGDVLAVGDVGWDDAAEIIIGDFSDGTIYIYPAGGGTALDSIACGFGEFDGLATGYVKPTGKHQIIFADASADHITVYNPSGTSLLDFPAAFDAHDGLAAGNVMTATGGETTLDEILVGHDDTIYIYDDADGALLTFFDVDHTFEAGDRLAAGNVRPSVAQHPEEIVIGDRNDYIYIYAANGYQYNAINTREFEYYDGLAVADVTGDGEEEILMADRDDQIKLVDAYYPRAALEAFKANTAGQDVILFSGHGNTYLWGPALTTGKFPLNFNNTKPFVFAPSCLTGNYEGNSDNSIAESFFDSGAVTYIGATEVSPIDKNVEANEWFFDHWGNTESIGSAFTQLERAVWEWNDWSYDWWEFWVYEYNLYGDPKVGTDGSVLPSSSQAQLAAPEAPTSLRDFHIPMFEVSVIDGDDSVEIPGGQRILAQGQYAIPYWTTSINYRPGTVVQDVAFVSRSGLTVTTGLSMPLTIIDHECVACETRGAVTSVVAEDAWFPEFEETHHWSVTEGDNGSTLLTIAMFPFFYNPATQDARFYQDFTFDVQTTSTKVSIQSVDTDRSTYVQGEPVSVTLVISNAGSAQDVIVEATVKAHPNTPVAGLPLRNLHDLSGWAEATFTWDSTGVPSGDYIVEIRLRNTGGDVLAQETQEFTLGVTGGDVTALTATPATFTVGDDIAIAMTFVNTGTVPITGTAVVQVYPADVVTATAEFTHTIANLSPGASILLNDAWDTTGATADAYRIVGYVKFNSQASATKVAMVAVRTQIEVYLPLVLRNVP